MRSHDSASRFRRVAYPGTWIRTGTVSGLQDQPSPPSSRPPADIPFARLTADATIATPLEPGAIASDEAVWVPGRASGTIVRIEAEGNVVGTPLAVGSQPCASLAIAFDSLWVPLCGDKGIARVDRKELKVTSTAKVAVANAEGRIASSVGSIWAITERKGVLSRIDPSTGASVAEIYVAGGAAAVEAGNDALWITSEDRGRLTRVNPHSNEVVDEITVGPKPVRLAVGEGGVWTLNGDGTVTRVNPETNKVVATISVGGDTATGDIAAGAGSVWVSTTRRADHPHRSADQSRRAAIHGGGWRRHPRRARGGLGGRRAAGDVAAGSAAGRGDASLNVDGAAACLTPSANPPVGEVPFRPGTDPERDAPAVGAELQVVDDKGGL